MRIRTIKPEFFNHEGLFDLESETGLPVRLAFIGLWCAADREGRFKWEPRRLGVQILPYDDADFSAVMNALEAGGHLCRYGTHFEFGFIPSFNKHQCINQREAQSKIPAPGQDVIETHVHAHASPARVPCGVNIPQPLRQTVIKRDGDACVRCGDTKDLTIDHIFPQSIGGTHVITNLRTLCRSCNSGRPVCGQPLIDDLAKDGFTLNDMQRICMHVHARGEGKGREGNGKEGKELLSAEADDDGYPALIENIWPIFPPMSRNRSSKAKLEKAWSITRQKPAEPQLIESLRKWATCHDWTREGGQFAPGAHIWVKDRKWESEPEQTSCGNHAVPAHRQRGYQENLQLP
jgi:hypothetical protein